jgi:hypothetical protein
MSCTATKRINNVGIHTANLLRVEFSSVLFGKKCKTIIFLTAIL